MNKRLFIGVPIQSEIASQFETSWRNSAELNDNRLNWAKPSNWHMTLFFLGETPVSKIGLLEELIDESFRDTFAFRTELDGVGLFPDIHHPKVMWIGLENVDPLLPSRTRLGEQLLQNQIDFDNKALKPHLTIARVKKVTNQESILSWFQEYRKMSFGPIKIDRIVLYESVLKPGGPEYLSVHQFILKEDK